MKIITLDKFQDLIDADFIWRKKELIEFKLNIRTTKNPIYVRAGLSLLCAHFEGFIRQIANYYVMYVSSQNIPFSKLKSNFAAIYSFDKMKQYAESNKISIYNNSFLSSLLFEYNNKNFKVRYSTNRPIIKTKGNPTSIIFEDIIHTIGLDFAPYKTKRNFIDSDLLSNRHKIIHGEKLYISMNDFEQTLNNILGIMETFHEQVFQAAYNCEYLLNSV